MSRRDVLRYTPVDDVARVQGFHRQGTCPSLGTFEDVQRDEAMASSTMREAAEAFAAGDPFVLQGVVERHEIRPYADVVAA